MSEEIRTWVEVEVAARARYGHLTPYRCGLIVGERGLSIEPPAGKKPRWLGHFRAGIGTGREWRKIRAAADPQ